MPQPPQKPWKNLLFSSLAKIERQIRPSTSGSLSTIRNFLVLQYESPLGSVVHATPFFEALKRAVPQAHITVAASRMAASVLHLNPCIDRCIVTPDPFREFREARNAVQDLLQSMPLGPRCIVTTIGNQRTRLALLTLGARNCVRAGYTLAPALYDVPLSFHSERGQIAGNLDIVRHLGHEAPFSEPRMFFSQQDVDDAAAMLQADPQTISSPRIACVTQNSGGQPNRWSDERFQQSIAKLTQTTNAIPIFVGTAADAPAIEALRRALSHPGISLAGKTTIPQLAAALAQCDLVISLDTGTFHVARAVGLPGVVLAPAWQSPLEWLPVDDARYRVLRGPSIPAPFPAYWLEEISADNVIQAATELLNNRPPDVAARIQRSLVPNTLRQ